MKGPLRALANLARPDTVTDTSALVTGLADGTTYYFWLAAGKAPNVVSNIASATPVALLRVPAARPQPARATAHRFCLAAVAGDSQVNLMWVPSAPGNNFTFYEGTTQGIGKPVQAQTPSRTRVPW